MEQELELSYYKDAAPINENHGIWLVQDQRSGKFYVRKTLTVFNKDIYRYLKNNPIHHTPKIHHVVEDGNTLVVIEDYIPGDTLEEILARKEACRKRRCWTLPFSFAEFSRRSTTQCRPL